MVPPGHNAKTKRYVTAVHTVNKALKATLGPKIKRFAFTHIRTYGQIVNGDFMTHSRKANGHLRTHDPYK